MLLNVLTTKKLAVAKGCTAERTATNMEGARGVGLTSSKQGGCLRRCPTRILPGRAAPRRFGAAMSPNEKSARLHAIVTVLGELRKEAIRLDEEMLGYILAMARHEARTAAEKSITRS
jgi:hypothetical protein